MKDESWIIVDTETDGLWEPIHVVEIAAQRMVGWLPEGEPFQVYLNHNVRIPTAATDVHGYTSDFLAEHGINPKEAHSLFGDYVGNLPIAAHNLSFDWNRALVPEWKRLRIDSIGERGFCTMTLCRRVIDETDNHKLETLKQYFNIQSGRSHQALADVETVVQLIRDVIAPRLDPLGFDSFRELARFSQKSPVANCLDIVKSFQQTTPLSKKQLANNWYSINAEGIKRGPFTEAHAHRIAREQNSYIWCESQLTS